MIILEKSILHYYSIYGDYGLLKKSNDIVKIHSWADASYHYILPQEQEVFFYYGLFNRKSAWAFTTDFLCFSDNKKELKKIKKKR